jgi:uracil-DNA glycosylase
MDSNKIRARARFALRAEKAFGLDALPIKLEPAPSPAIPSLPLPASGQSAAPPRIPQPVRTTPLPQAAPVVSARQSIVNLFGATPSESFTSPPRSSEEKRKALANLDANHVKRCANCILHERRTNTVFGEGDPDAPIMFIGEGPGENEDLQGRPFVGRAGELLNKMIAGMGLKREQVYIANIVKCRPPGNREPAPDEVATCTPFLEKQIEIIRPKVIVTLGRPAAQHMLQQKISISKMRGQWQTWRGIKLMPTFHPAYILRNYTEQTRAAVWSDLQQVMTELGMKLPARGNRE